MITLIVKAIIVAFSTPLSRCTTLTTKVQRPLGFRQFQSCTLSSTRDAKDSIQNTQQKAVNSCIHAI